MAASVVDLPEPVGPVTSTKPLPCNSAGTASGTCRSSNAGAASAMQRNTVTIAGEWLANTSMTKTLAPAAGERSE